MVSKKQKMHGRKTLWIAFAVVLVDMLGVGILIPVIPLLFTDPAYPYHFAISAHDGYLLLGALTALYPFTMFLTMPILGQLSDTFGRRPLLIWSLFGTAISYGLFALGIYIESIPLLFISRALDGLTGANVAVAQSAIADTSTEEERASKFGYIAAANGIGFILGPLIGAFLSDTHTSLAFGAPTPFLFAAGLSTLNMLAVLFLFPETLTRKTKEYIQFSRGFQHIKEAVTDAKRRVMYITTFLFQSGFAFIITFFGVYLVSRFDFGQREIGYLFAFVGFLLILTQVGFTGPFSHRVSPKTAISSSLAALGIALVGVYLSHTPLMLYLWTIPAAIGAAITLTNLPAFISTSSSEEEQGSALGINSSIQALAQAIPPLFAGVVAAIFAPTTPILFSAIIVGAAALYFFLATRTRSFNS